MSRDPCCHLQWCMLSDEHFGGPKTARSGASCGNDSDGRTGRKAGAGRPFGTAAIPASPPSRLGPADLHLACQSCRALGRTSLSGAAPPHTSLPDAASGGAFRPEIAPDPGCGFSSFSQVGRRSDPPLLPNCNSGPRRARRPRARAGRDPRWRSACGRRTR